MYMLLNCMMMCLSTVDSLEQWIKIVKGRDG